MRRRVRLLQAASMTSSFDRFVVGPLLLSIAGTFGVTLVQASAVVSWYLVCYGLAQPVWGLCCDRFGRVRTMRATLAVAAAAGAVASVAPTLAVLVGARAVAGACIAAVIPAGLIYVGDVVPIGRRQRTLSDIQSAQAVGTMAATVAAGVLAVTASWRTAMAVPAVVAFVLVVALRTLPEPVRAAGSSAGRGAVLRSRWAGVVLALALVEGAALLGFLAYLAPALESGGFSPLVAGGVVALYGVGLLLASRVVRRVAARRRPAVLVGVGAAVLALAYAVVAVDQGLVGVGLAAFGVGVAWAPLHSTMQTWATQVVPAARATMVSGYATMLFVGSGLATWAVAPLAGETRWGATFVVGAALAVLTGVTAAVARARYDAHLSSDGAAGGRPGRSSSA